MLTALIGPVSNLLGKFIEDKDMKNKLAHEVATMAESHAQELAKGQLAINQTEAGLPDGCGFIYNSAAINAGAGGTLCDARDISIKQFIALRRETLYQELQENGL